MTDEEGDPLMNCVAEVAKANKRNYITPEDVADALRKTRDPDSVRLAVLEVLGKQTEFGAEDYTACAFVAFQGKAD